MTYLKKLDLKGWLILIGFVIVFFAFVLPWITKNVGGTLKKAFAKLSGGIIDDGTKGEPISDIRKGEIKAQVTALYDAIYSWISWEPDTIAALEFFLALPDNEAVFFVNEYEKLSENSMYYDVDWEFMPAFSADDEALARLKSLGFDY